MKPIANIRLRRAMQIAGLTFKDIACKTDANLKTVQRWVYEGRTPRQRRAEKVAELLGVELFWLWPDSADHRDRDRDDVRDSCQMYPSVAGLPPSFFRQVFLSATRELDLLTDSEWLLAQLEGPRQPKSTGRLSACPPARLLVSPLFVRMYSSGVLDAEVRRHPAVGGTSIVRADDTMILIPGGGGMAASASPVLFLSRMSDDGPFDRYVQGFEALWEQAAAMSDES